MNRQIKGIVSLVLILVLTIAWMPMTQVQAQTVKTYTVTLRAGNVGSFDIAKVESVLPEAEVTANYIRFQVNRGSSLVDMGFFKEEAQLDSVLLNTIIIDGSYLLKSASGIANQQITANTEYVIDYGKLVDPVEYSIYFVDSESGEQIATPTLAYGNAGDVINAVPMTLDGYDTEDKAQELVLSKEGENTITFHYSFVQQEPEEPVIDAPQEQEEEEEPETIVVTEYVDVPVVTVTGTENETGADTEDGVDTEAQEEAVEEENQQENQSVEIEEDEVPLADTEVNETEIQEDDIPLATTPVQENNMVLVAVGVAIMIIIIGVVALLHVKKKKGRVEKK